MLSEPELRHRLQEALDFGGGNHSIEELVEETLAGRMQCWHTDQAVVFTTVQAWGKTKILNIYCAAGALDDVLALQDEFLPWARQQGCTGAHVHGRLGWAKVLPAEGWQPRYMTWERAI